MNRKIFRDKALEKLSSPDNINELVSVTSRRSWLALFALAGITLALILWSVFGKLSKTVSGQGILIQSGGIAEVNVLSAGVIDSVFVQEGQAVNVGTPIALIADPSLEIQVKNIVNQINGLEKDSLPNKVLINQLKEEIEKLRQNPEKISYILSSYKGRVIEITGKKGDFVEAGFPISNIEIKQNDNSALQAVIYVAPEEGKKIKAKMNVRIAPSTIKVEEYGYVEGVVQNVSEYPATRYGMEKVLGNPDLVRTFSEGEPPIAVTVKLRQNPQNKNFYQWTSQRGQNLEINPGTLCSASIIVGKVSPIELLLPTLRENLDI